MPNITFAVEDSALASAKAYASERSTSLNKLVNAYLKSLGQSQPRRAVSKADEALLDYSLGRKSLLETAERLGVQDCGHVLALMRRAGLPLPQLAEDMVQQQVGGALEFLKRPRTRSGAAVRKRKPARR